MLKSFLPMLLILVIAASSQARQEEQITVYVKIDGFKNEEGLCRLLLFDGEKGFPDSGRDAAMMLSEYITGKAAEISLKITPGRYALSVIHDENSNGKLDQTWYGKPMEGFGSSNNPAAGYGPPGFEESEVNLDANNNRIIIKLNYL
ncbi:MAG: DUF2141 domain-containing protein [Deltaproteobacteria bacterium]|nr:DUF2141 domain-containing protein [Deltaproteobacteria bacterium]